MTFQLFKDTECVVNNALILECAILREILNSLFLVAIDYQPVETSSSSTLIHSYELP